MKEINTSNLSVNSGARGGNRTRMAFRPQDFKSCVYTISPPGQKYNNAIFIFFSRKINVKALFDLSKVESNLFF